MKNNNAVIIIKKELEKYKNFTILSLVLAVFFVLPQICDWANNTFIKLHFCNHFFCMLFSIIFFAFAYFAWTKKRSYLNIAIIVLIVGIILMNITYCDNGIFLKKDLSIKGLFTTSPLIKADTCMAVCEGWDVGYASKILPEMGEIEVGCLEEGDLFVDETEMLITSSSTVYDEVNKIYCCCYNINTCEKLGYISGTPEGDVDRYELINIGGLVCWKEKEIIEPKIICCEMYNLDKIGEKIDIFYDFMTEEECNQMLITYDRINIVDKSLCEK